MILCRMITTITASARANAALKLPARAPFGVLNLVNPPRNISMIIRSITKSSQLSIEFCIYSYCYSFLFLKSFSILSVIVNPPTTLNAARAIAIAPSRVSVKSDVTAKTRSAPSIVTAEMALVIDINGVCNNGGTFEISKYPMMIDRINTETIINNSFIIIQLKFNVTHQAL